MKNFFSIFLLFGLLASSFVCAEDRTSDPNDQDTLNVVVAETDGSWQANLASQDSLTNEDFNIDIKIQPSDQDDDDFDDYHDSDGDDNDDIQISGASFGSALKEGLEKNADGDFDLDLIRKEILRKARDQDDVDYTNDDDSTDSTDLDSPSQPERDNGKISTQMASTDDDNANDDEIEDSDDGDDADIIDDNTDSNDDDEIDDDYQQDNDSAMADDDYVNDPDAINDDLADEVDYNDDDSDDGDDVTDNFLSQAYVKNTPFDSVNLQRIKLNMTTIDISPQDSDDTDDGLDDIYYNANDDDDSDSDFYDIYDSKYQEEPERGGSDDSNDSSYDYDIFIDVDDSAWDSYLTNDNGDDDM